MKSERVILLCSRNPQISSHTSFLIPSCQYPPNNNKMYRFLEETEEIEVTEFVDFFHNVVDLCRLDVAGAKRAMQEIISNHSEDGRKSKAKTVDYINQKTLLEEMNLSMLSEDIDLAQVR